MLNDPIGALAHLGLGRAYATQGDPAKAKAAPQDFLTLWKDADSDIPILSSLQSLSPQGSISSETAWRSRRVANRFERTLGGASLRALSKGAVFEILLPRHSYHCT